MGLLDRVLATGCPATHTYRMDLGEIVISGTPGTPDFPVAYAPRRTLLDKILVDAAAEAGAEVREGFIVEELILDGDPAAGIRDRDAGGRTVTEHARVVIGGALTGGVLRPPERRGDLRRRGRTISA